MRYEFITNRIDYDGSQLASHFAYKTASLVGDSVVAFIGACDVSFKSMVDVADLEARCKILSREMLHFIVEHFDAGLESAVLRQRLLVSILQQNVNTRLIELGARELVLRKGDDLFVGKKKLTVSVATKSAVSCLIHLGVNIDAAGAPVEAIGLSELLPGHDYEAFTGEVMRQYAEELSEISEAMALVRGVGEYAGGAD